MNADENSVQRAMETTDKHSDVEHEMELYVYLVPSSEIQTFKVCPTTSIRDLKVLSEEKCGIPSDVLLFMHNAVVLDDSTTLLDLGCSEYAVLDLFVHPIWEKIIRSCLKGENEQVMARVNFRMNQLSLEARAFVAAFITAHKQNSELFQLMIESFKERVMFQTVCLSGRSLLHAAVLGGNINCVMTLVINGGWKLLNQADTQGEVPLDIAQRMKKEEGLVQILTKYNDMYIDRHWVNDANFEWEGLQSEDTIKKESKETLAGYESGQNENLPENQGSSSMEEEEPKMLPNPPTQGTPEMAAAGIGHRLLQRSKTPQLHIPTPQEEENATKSSIKYPTRNQMLLQKNVGNGGVQLPLVITEENRSPLISPKCPHQEFLLDMMGRRGSFPRDIKRARSPSSPTLPRTKHLPKQLIARPRAGSLMGQQESYNVQSRDIPPRAYLSSSAPNSPILHRKRHTLPVSPLACPRFPFGCRSSFSADQNKPSRLHGDLMTEKTRETLPWNVWKAVSAWKAFELDDTSTKSHDKGDEEERMRTYRRMSGHRKSFEVWLADKEHEKVKKYEEVATKAKRLSELKSLEETQRRTRAKSFDEWLKEKETSLQEQADNDVTETKTEARRAQASFKYQQWMQKKDEEALAREEKIRAEEQRKHEELQRKREEEQRARSLREKAGNANSVPR